MRSIKFRSWDARNKQMDIPDNIANGIDGDKYQIMQYTGLLDKQGKEIYEGDILEFAVYNAIGKVIWDDRYFGWWVKLLHSPVDKCQNISLFDAYTSVGWEDSIEVIGNVYENGELLKG